MPAAVAVLLSSCAGTPSDAPLVRVATFNVSLFRDDAGQLADDLDEGDARAADIAAIIQRVRPDVLLLNEFDHDASGRALRSFRERYLERPARGGTPIRYPYAFTAEVNTGVPSGLDLDGDGRVTADPNDCWGYGRHPGQYGMLVLSRFPIDADAVRTFRHLRWSAMPDNAIPPDHWTDEIAAELRLSSKSHWDIPIELPDDRTLHLLASHPTPPVFDGPEDRNGRRNHDEIRLWAEYLRPESADWIVDDRGRRGGLPADALFVVCGDQNADPFDGDSHEHAITQLTDHERIDDDAPPRSRGAAEAALVQGAANREHVGPAATDTGDFRDHPGPGNLRLDYVLPSRQCEVVGSGVYWPRPGEIGSKWIEATDHRMVWIDLR
jgi:hypothetical protein